MVLVMFLLNIYKMYYDIDKEKFVGCMVDEFKNFWIVDWKVRLKEVGLKLLL